MKLHIEKTSLIKDIQIEFNSIYPYLKIEICKYRSDSPRENKVNAVKDNMVECIGSRETFSKSTSIDVDGQRTVSQLEHDFSTTLGLSVNLFRKSGKMWIQTTLTNNWSLKKQNEEGEFMSSPDFRQDLLKADK
jgi:hypothetical protein